MKKIRNIVLGLMLFIGLQGCGDFLTVEIPDQLLKKDYWKTRDQVEAALNGVYYQLGQNITRFITWGDARSDIYINFSGAAVDYAKLVEQDIKTTNALLNWSNVYVGINWANSFLKNVETVLEYDQSVTREEVLAMKAEVYAIRALYYFYLVRTFQDVPVSLEPYESDKQAAYTPAYPETKVFEVIEGDLKEALMYAPASFADPAKNCGRITKNAVKAIWADVKLWKGEYKGCQELCEELEKVYDGKMLRAESWFSIFAQGNASESIFEYQYIDEKRLSPIASYYRTYTYNEKAFTNNVKKVYPGSGSLVTSDTVRYKRSCYGGVVFKYRGMSASNNIYVYRDVTSEARINFIFYRYREVLLMKAEAMAMQGLYDEAIVPINKIRKVTGLEEVIATEYGKDRAFMDKLLCERAAELGFEGKQWFSMVRIAMHTGYDDLLVDRIASTNLTVKEQTMKARLVDRRGWFLPYLKSEVENNLDLKQKEFYLGKD